MSRKYIVLLIPLTILIFIFSFLFLNMKNNSSKNNRYQTETPNFRLTLISESMDTHLKKGENKFYNQSEDIVVNYFNLNSNFLATGEYKYLGVKDGKIAIFKRTKSGETLQEVTGINLNELPEKERIELKKGIIVNSDEELIKILEGLVSYNED